MHVWRIGMGVTSGMISITWVSMWKTGLCIFGKNASTCIFVSGDDSFCHEHVSQRNFSVFTWYVDICCNCTYIPQRKRCLHARLFTCLKPRCIHHKKRSTEKTHVIMKSHENFFLISKSCFFSKCAQQKAKRKNHAIKSDIVLVKLLKMETLDCVQWFLTCSYCKILSSRIHRLCNPCGIGVFTHCLDQAATPSQLQAQ